MSEDPRPKKEIQAVKGTKDILPCEVGLWQEAESLAKQTFELYGYREIRTPVFELTELFEKGTGPTSDVVTKEMYTFVDKGGRSLTLRPEYTPSVVRAIIEHRLYLQPEPLRFYYIGPMFRYDKPQKGRFRQFHQVDIEVFGEKDPAIDAEIIGMALALLGKLGAGETKTLVNSVGCKKCRPVYMKKLRLEAERCRNALCADCQRKIDTNPLRVFDCKVDGCREATKSFPKILDDLCSECREHFAGVCSYLDMFRIPYTIEPRLVRGLDYYTKTAFEIVSSGLGAQNALAGGGRYDDMMSEFGGPDMCGIGFAMGLERLLSVVDGTPAKRPFVYIAHLGMEARRAGMELARFFREAGIECLIEFKDKGLKGHMGRANKVKAAWVLIIGEEELEKGRYPLKDMVTGLQEEGTREEILEKLKGKP
ncbi:MAG: histidine--tRNA ligase [Acidobacteriota bacterium]|nr:histidine--tRNA ligase [Acidobacteriota bacterium]